MRPAARIALAAVVLVLAVAVVWLLFTIVFPWVDGLLVPDPALPA